MRDCKKCGKPVKFARAKDDYEISPFEELNRDHIFEIVDDSDEDRFQFNAVQVLSPVFIRHICKPKTEEAV